MTVLMASQAERSLEFLDPDRGAFLFFVALCIFQGLILAVGIWECRILRRHQSVSVFLVASQLLLAGLVLLVVYSLRNSNDTGDVNTGTSNTSASFDYYGPMVTNVIVKSNSLPGQTNSLVYFFAEIQVTWPTCPMCGAVALLMGDSSGTNQGLLCQTVCDDATNFAACSDAAAVIVQQCVNEMMILLGTDHNNNSVVMAYGDCASCRAQLPTRHNNTSQNQILLLASILILASFVMVVVFVALTFFFPSLRDRYIPTPGPTGSSATVVDHDDDDDDDSEAVVSLPPLPSETQSTTSQEDECHGTKPGISVP